MSGLFTLVYTDRTGRPIARTSNNFVVTPYIPQDDGIMEKLIPASARPLLSIASDRTSDMANNLGFEDYAKALAGRTGGVIDLRPIQISNANALKEQLKP